MSDRNLGAVEARFADIIWQNEPLSSAELVRQAGDALGWKKSTTYTVLKRLSQRGLFQNRDGVVTSLISRADFYAARSEQFVDETFSGSLPAFFAAFTAKKALTEEELDQLQALIDGMRR